MQYLTQAEEVMDHFTQNEVKEYLSKDISKSIFEKLFYSAKYHFYVLREAPGLGEESFGDFIRIIEKLADLDYPKAIYEMGLIYYNGVYRTKDVKKSFDLHKKAAELGDSDAQFEMYVLLSTGQGTEVDKSTALEWCKMAAEQNQLRAVFNMGAFYATGQGVELDMKEAVNWYKKASDLGHGKASAILGVMYKKGSDVEQNDNLAEEYFTKAEEQEFDLSSFLKIQGITRKQ